jgi:hypothetical protein
MIFGDKVFSFVLEGLSASFFKVPKLGSQNSPDPIHKHHHLSNIRHVSLKILVDIKKTNAGMARDPNIDGRTTSYRTLVK